MRWRGERRCCWGVFLNAGSEGVRGDDRAAGLRVDWATGIRDAELAELGLLLKVNLDRTAEFCRLT